MCSCVSTTGRAAIPSGRSRAGEGNGRLVPRRPGRAHPGSPVRGGFFYRRHGRGAAATNRIRAHRFGCGRYPPAADWNQAKPTPGGEAVGATIRPLPGLGDLPTYRVEPDFGSGGPAAPRGPAGAAARKGPGMTFLRRAFPRGSPEGFPASAARAGSRSRFRSSPPRPAPGMRLPARRRGRRVPEKTGPFPAASSLCQNKR